MRECFAASLFFERRSQYLILSISVLNSLVEEVEEDCEGHFLIEFSIECSTDFSKIKFPWLLLVKHENGCLAALNCPVDLIKFEEEKGSCSVVILLLFDEIPVQQLLLVDNKF